MRRGRDHPIRAAILAVCLGPAGPGVGFAQSAVEAWRQILPSAENPNPGIRADAADRIGAWGREALPLLREAIDSGSLNRCRLAHLALARSASDPEVASVLLASYRRPRQGGLDLVAAIALAGAGEIPVSADLAAVVLDPQEEPIRRIAGALALAATGFGAEASAAEAAVREEKDPIVAGAISAALGLAGVESAIPSLEERLGAAKEPPLRAGLLLGLASLGRRAVPFAEDLLADDPVLPWVAALHFPDAPPDDPTSPAAASWKQAMRSSDASLRAALFAALARGTEDRSRAILTEAAVTETDPRVRAAVYGSGAARGAAEILRTVRRVDEDEASAFAAVAWMLEGRPGGLRESDRLTLDRAVAALAGAGDESVRSAALLLGASRRPEAESLLASALRRAGIGGEAARLARKHLRGELDPRAFSEAVVRNAFRRGVLFESALAEAAHRMALSLVGAGSEYFSRRPELEGRARALRAWVPRRHGLPTDSPLYEDAGILLERRPFDEVCLRRASR